LKMIQAPTRWAFIREHFIPTVLGNDLGFVWILMKIDGRPSRRRLFLTFPGPDGIFLKGMRKPAVPGENLGAPSREVRGTTPCTTPS
jgi:hypothetical protein